MIKYPTFSDKPMFKPAFSKAYVNDLTYNLLCIRTLIILVSHGSYLVKSKVKHRFF